MDVLVKLLRVASVIDIPKLRKILQSLETSVQNLTDLNMEMNSYGTLLIRIIFDRIPNELQIIISRKFKNDVWDLRNLTEIVKQERLARERHYVIGKEMLCYHWTLIAHSFTRKGKIIKTKFSTWKLRYYDDKKHISSRCNVITNVETRKNLLKNQGRCFICLSKGYVSKICKANYSCMKCKNRHHVRISSAKDDK